MVNLIVQMNDLACSVLIIPALEISDFLTCVATQGTAFVPREDCIVLLILLVQ